MEALEVPVIMAWPCKPRLESALTLSCTGRHRLRFWRQGATFLYFLTTYIHTGLNAASFHCLHVTMSIHDVAKLTPCQWRASHDLSCRFHKPSPRSDAVYILDIQGKNSAFGFDLVHIVQRQRGMRESHPWWKHNSKPSWLSLLLVHLLLQCLSRVFICYHNLSYRSQSRFTEYAHNGRG
ncbi:hypothetical protein IW261DRAFT_481522 [Armillaria novae-zelandiae]|uniref:Uncharacterized protein n=1 Tax=Armillaria novae-zelandiae TaxID=153914 RepID=A0AA39P193_9AGAR|nr:hypothetical protein IW261DRAFT_481522 [Armillaria novae-zelandiae]